MSKFAKGTTKVVGIRINYEVWEKLKVIAARKKTTRNAIVVQIVEKYCQKNVDKL